MRALAIGLALLGGCVLVPPATHPTASAPNATTEPTASSAPTAASEPDDPPRPPRAPDPDYISSKQVDTLVGMTIDDARAQLKRWGYHGNLQTSTSHLVKATCANDHVCEVGPTEFPLDGDVVFVIRAPAHLAPPPPP